jgi:hypothetical protein
MAEITYNAELSLRNVRNEDAVMTVQPDNYQDEELVSFSFTCDKTPIILDPSNEEPIENEHFQVNKPQLGYLIDFLQRVYSSMP